MFKVNNKHQNDFDVVLVLLLLTFIYFTPFSNVFIVDFEQLNVNWVTLLYTVKL